MNDVMIDTGTPRPAHLRLAGQCVVLEPLKPSAHGDALWQCAQGDREHWRYLFSGPFESRTAFMHWLEGNATHQERLYFVVVVAGRAMGLVSYMNIEPSHRVLEIGDVGFFAPLRRTRAATEVFLLLLKAAFECGYRRVEWKCDARNLASRRAAERLGFRFEGLFLQHRIVKGQNRDTQWYAMLESEWPRCQAALHAWCSNANFDAQGRQRQTLSRLREGLRASM